jgi:hypothetical protein
LHFLTKRKPETVDFTASGTRREWDSNPRHHVFVLFSVSGFSFYLRRFPWSHLVIIDRIRVRISHI